MTILFPCLRNLLLSFQVRCSVAGTAIGGGMLALPVLTSPAGFFPSVLIFLLCWLFMMSTGLLFLELCLKFRDGVNFITMARESLGKWGERVVWALYLFLFYCLTVAYIVGCGNLLSVFFPALGPSQGPLLFVALTAPLVYLGARLVQRFNIFFMLAMGALYAVFVVFGLPSVNLELLGRSDWSKAFFALPIAFTAFAYHGIIPTLAHNMHYDPRKSRLAVLIGSMIPLFAYVIWELLILGIVPFESSGGLRDALLKGENGVTPLKNFIGHPTLYAVGQAFAFLALLTSYFGVTLGLLDFLMDGLKVKRNAVNRFWLCLLIFLPPLGVALLYPTIFLVALEYAGGLGCAALLGLLPILMVWVGRYHLKWPLVRELPGGRPLLIILALFVLFEIGFELRNVVLRFLS